MLASKYLTCAGIKTKKLKIKKLKQQINETNRKLQKKKIIIISLFLTIHDVTAFVLQASYKIICMYVCQKYCETHRLKTANPLPPSISLSFSYTRPCTNNTTFFFYIYKLCYITPTREFIFFIIFVVVVSIFHTTGLVLTTTHHLLLLLFF